MQQDKSVLVQGNLLLGTLALDEQQALAPYLRPYHAQHGEIICERGSAAEHVYFPCTAVLSVLAFMADGAAVEVGTIGNEGFRGIEVLMGGDTWTETTVSQIEGDGFRMAVQDFRSAAQPGSSLQKILQQYLLAYLSMVSQSVACNRLHTIEERFARWVLMTHDRVGGDRFYLTQEFIADMLGVHRPSVSLVASAFQQAGLIRYSRGDMQILNRCGLEDVCCECYAIVSQQFDRLLGLPARTGIGQPRTGADGTVPGRRSAGRRDS